jgi:hypothetical protein
LIWRRQTRTGGLVLRQRFCCTIDARDLHWRGRVPPRPTSWEYLLGRDKTPWLHSYLPGFDHFTSPLQNRSIRCSPFWMLAMLVA